MNKQRMNVQTIAEILTEELGKIEKHTEKFQHASSRVEQATERLLKTEVKVNTSELLQIQANIERTFKDSVFISKKRADFFFWFIAVLISLTVCLSMLLYHYTDKYYALKNRYENYQSKTE